VHLVGFTTEIYYDARPHKRHFLNSYQQHTRDDSRKFYFVRNSTAVRNNSVGIASR